MRMIRFLWFMQLMTRAARFIIPWITRFFASLAWFIIISVVSFWSGVPAVVEKMANDWLDRAVQAKFPTQFDRPLYYAFIGVAWITLVLGWITLSYLTVWIMHLIFH